MRLRSQLRAGKLRGEMLMRKDCLTTTMLAFTAGLIIAGSLPAAALADTLRGQVTGPYGERVANAPIRVIDADSIEHARSRTSADGSYEFSDLPPGTVRVQVRTTCCEFRAFASDPIRLAGTETFNIRLEQGFQLNTLGDDVGIANAAMLARRNVPDQPMPTDPGGRPILTGLWLYGDDPFPPAPELQAWAAELVAERNANQFIDSPRIRCLPTSLPIPTHTPPILGKFLDTPGLVVILYEGILGYRQIFTDGRPHPEDPNPTWLGHSIGWWDGDVFVVDTIGFNDDGWTGLTHPRSEAFHVVERYRRTSLGEMELELTIEDPNVYMQPWVRRMPLYLVPDEELLEYVCENEKWVIGSDD